MLIWYNKSAFISGLVMFEEELDYFITNQQRLVKEHAGKVLVIKGHKIIGVYDSDLDAYSEAKKRGLLGSVMIQPCEAGPDAYTVTISSLQLF